MNPDEIKTELMKIAAGCFRKDAFPPLSIEDWALPESASRGTRILIQKHLTRIGSEIHQIGMRVKRVIDSLPQTDPDLGLKSFGESMANYQAENRRQ